MTVPSEIARNDYIGNGVTVAFPYTFRLIEATHVRVILSTDGVESELVLDTDFTVSGVGSPSGGTVTTTTAPASDVAVAILRQVPGTQLTDLRNQSSYYPEDIENAFDLAAMRQLQQQDAIDRSLHLPESEAGSELLTVLPALSDRKGKQLTFDPTTGQPAASSPSSAAVSAAMQAVVASATLALARSAMGVSGIGFVNVKDAPYNAVGDGSTDDTAAFNAALASGKSILVPPGIYMVDPLTIPVGFKGLCIQGSGFYHYAATSGTVIKARTAAQASVFALANGADCVSIRDLRIEGDNKAQKGIDSTYGAFLTLETVGVYNCTAYGSYHKQGLARISKCFYANPAVGIHLYSDSAISDSEFSLGTVPILIVAGGNRLVNVWANTGSACCVRLAPFDASTTLINTAIVNLYAGECPSATVVPILDIAGTVSQRVQQVMISGGSHFVHAASGNYINGGISISKANDVTITGCTFRGQDTSAVSAKYTAYGVLANDCDCLCIHGNTFRGITKNPVDLTTVPGLVISSNSFQNCGSTLAAGDEGAAIRLRDAACSGSIGGNSFYVANGSSVPFAIKGADATSVLFENSLINYPSATVASFVAGTWMGKYQRVGAVPSQWRNTADRNYTQRGQFSTGAGAVTVDITTLATLAENQSYILMIMQNSGGSNGTFGAVSIYNTNAGASTIGNTNTAPLANTISMSGATIRFTQGAGYGATTWDWALERIG